MSTPTATLEIPPSQLSAEADVIPAVPPISRRFRVRDLLVAMRPRQWVKNTLVFGAPLAAGRFFEWPVVGNSVAAFAMFCAAASAGYLINDVTDRAVDAHHPRKRRRPIAAGRVSPTLALSVAAALAVVSLVIAWNVRPELLIVCVLYLVMQTSYCLALRAVAVLDLLAVAGGFLLRAIAGGVACDIPLTGWFVSVVGFASLFLVAGKRYSEVVATDERPMKRELATVYTASYLRLVWGAAMALTLAAYCLWVFNGATADTPWRAATILPFVAAVLRYAQLIDTGQAEEPENVLLSDRMLQGCGVAWLLVMIVTTLLAP